MNTKITIKEIAKLAHVSVSTVSRVINDSPSVSATKRAAVQKVIDEYNFQPSMVARSMVSQTTHTLAVITPDITNPYFTSLIAQIERYGREQDYSLLLFNTMTAGHSRITQTVATEIKAFDTILEKKVDGVIILGGEIDRDQVDPEYLQALNALNDQVPADIIGQPDPDCHSLFIKRDEDMAAKLITTHLLATGYHRIGFIGGEPGIKITTQRLQAFKNTMSIYATLNDNDIILSDFYTQDGYQSALELLKHQDLPDAIVAINDRVAEGAIRAFLDNGLHVPEDIAIASCDAFPDGEWGVPRLTTIDHHNEILGKIAVQQLLHQINNEALDSVQTHLPELIIRESCGAKLKREAHS